MANFDIFVNEQNVAQYFGVLRATAKPPAVGDPLLKANVNSITLTLYDVASNGKIINGRDEVDVFDVNGGTLTVDTGEFQFDFTADDNPIINKQLVVDRNKLERHVALFRVVYDETQTINHDVDVYVKQMRYVP